MGRTELAYETNSKSRLSIHSGIILCSEWYNPVLLLHYNVLTQQIGSEVVLREELPACWSRRVNFLLPHLKTQPPQLFNQCLPCDLGFICAESQLVVSLTQPGFEKTKFLSMFTTTKLGSWLQF